jgi:hypothetical protein
MNDTNNDTNSSEATQDMRDADLRNGEPDATVGSKKMPPGRDTPTGTDPDAEYVQPGYEDKSLGQAVEQDQELVEQLVDEEGGDEEAAAERFTEESHGATAMQRQGTTARDD